jgi:hypothetical protein
LLAAAVVGPRAGQNFCFESKADMPSGSENVCFANILFGGDSYSEFSQRLLFAGGD